ncbi:nardilysin-like [Daktulosphaira vitifoliae]|uniref:nardilysin-like n=1 Tax=Daktulosphaira vitifoliae TaxID=58002 RepID=UPI0021AA049F|nr:nardilysin-like [Daktulosphaira vitifoliae]
MIRGLMKIRCYSLAYNVIDPPVKHIGDPNLYRNIILSNKLRICVVSNVQDESLSACALCVRAGSFFEPDHIPGLSHYVEHLLFLGSAKYPKPYTLLNELEKAGGCCNATTDAEHVTYFMQTPTHLMSEFIDQFGHMFIDPLITPQALKLERKRVDKEFGQVISSDQLRAEQILATAASVGHPAGKFTWGNRSSIKLGPILKSAVLEFISKFYTANRMTLVIHSPKKIENNIIEIAIKVFSNIKSKSKDNDISFDRAAFNSNKFQKLFTVKPEAKNLNEVQLNWLVPSVYPHYKSRPLEFVGRLFNSQYSDKLNRDFKNRGWSVVSTWAGVAQQQFRSNSWYAIFTIHLTLLDITADNKLSDIVRRVFDYMATIRVTKAQSSCVYRRIMSDVFPYPMHLVPPLNAAIRIAKHMQYYQPRDYLEHFGEFVPDFKSIQNYMDELLADKVSITIQSHRFAKHSNLNMIEPWFNTEYRIDEIPQSWLSLWRKAAFDDSFLKK